MSDVAWRATCGVTDSNGVFHDRPFGYCGFGADTYSGTQTLKFIINGVDYIVRTNYPSWTTTGVAGKGTISNGNDVSISH